MADNTLIVLAALVLLPLIPAFVLFKVLRSTGDVTGPLGSFKVALGGAFGGYFALTVFIATFYASTLNKAGVEEWTVRGSFQFDPSDPPEQIYCRIAPVLPLDPGNRFEWRIPMVKGAATPRIAVEPAGYEGETLYLSKQTNTLNPPDYKVSVDESHRQITFEPIKFRKVVRTANGG